MSSNTVVATILDLHWEEESGDDFCFNWEELVWMRGDNLHSQNGNACQYIIK